jgi:hypothetical protein
MIELRPLPFKARRRARPGCPAPLAPVSACPSRNLRQGPRRGGELILRGFAAVAGKDDGPP